jgi:hypothetical protein
MTERIDRTRVLALLAEVVAEVGEDHVYPDYGGFAGCKYFSDSGQPLCIVGHVLAKLGVDPALVNQPAHYSDSISLNGVGIDSVCRQLGSLLPNFTPDAIAVLSAAQRVQDDGKTWGEALRYAREYMAVTA